MTIKQHAADWFSVYYRGFVVADCSTLDAAVHYVRIRGWAVKITE